MANVLLQAASFLLIILLVFLLKQFKLLSKQDGRILSVIILNVTLPAAIIISLADVSVNTFFFLLALIGFSQNFILILIGNFLSKSKPLVERKFFMYSVTGYNIGNFSLPFVQGFFPSAMSYLCMFDIGNSFMLAGGSTLLIDKVTEGRRKSANFVQTLKNLFTSIPFLTYFILFF